MNTAIPIKSDHSTEWHWEKFAEFCRFKAEVNEPSPHMQMIGLITEGEPIEEVIWFTGLYANFYNIPSALAAWYFWTHEETKDGFPGDWLAENWEGLTTRIERRTVRTVKNMTECLNSYLDWMNNKLPIYLGPAYANMRPDENDALYDQIWQEAEASLRFMGRYIIIRLLEGLHRFAGLQPHLYDIRSIGGWSPKRALGLLYPEHLDLLMSSDTKENILRVDAIAYSAMEKFASEYGTPMSPYVFAAMLCEYRVAYEKHHQYPGWTIDQEPAHWHKIKPFWLNKQGQEFVDWLEEKFYGTRLALFPNENLGEIHGWPDTRVEPRATLRKHGYNWSDKRYDFNATTDFGNPVKR